MRVDRTRVPHPVLAGIIKIDELVRRGQAGRSEAANIDRVLVQIEDVVGACAHLAKPRMTPASGALNLLRQCLATRAQTMLGTHKLI